MYRYQSLWCQGERNPVLLQLSLHSSFFGRDLSGTATAEFAPWNHSAYAYWGFYLELERKHDPSVFYALLDQGLDEFSIFPCSSFRKCCFVPGDPPSELLWGDALADMQLQPCSLIQTHSCQMPGHWVSASQHQQLAPCKVGNCWGRELLNESQLPHLCIPTNSQPKYFHPYSHQIPPLL